MTKAIVFTHLTVPRDLQPVVASGNAVGLDEWCRRRIQMYANCNSIGLVYVFMAEGYQAILSSKRPWEGLDEERVLRELLETAVRGLAPHDRHKIQIVGTRELTPTMASLSRLTKEEDERKKLGDLLLGSGHNLNYDSPKVVEAMIRLARADEFGEEPIFRFDADVEVDDKNVLCLLDYYEQLTNKKEKCYFFLGGYHCSEPATPAGSLLNGYAVRTAQFCAKARGVVTLDIARAERFLNDLPAIGGDPYNQVISGAGLCMSPKAIRVLPPFANVAELIIWIDDHLKRVLHKDMGHFGCPKDQSRRCEATFVQDRHPHGITRQDMTWHSNQYLERLVRGCLLDAMIQDRRQSGRGQVAGLVDDYVTKGLPLDRGALGRRLRPIGVKRLKLIEATWNQPVYSRSAVDVFAKERLPGKSGRELVSEAIKGVDKYFDILEIWKEFVGLCQSIPRIEDNHWLFRT